MNVLLAAPAWEPYADEFAYRLAREWTLKIGLEGVADADALIATSLPVDLLPEARRLRVFAYPGAGASHITADELPAGCVLTNVYEHEGPIAEYVMMTMLVHTTEFFKHVAALRRGEWQGSGRNGGTTHGELAGRTVGLFGRGHIGREVERRAVAFGMRVLATTRSGGDLQAMLPECEFLVIAAPLTEETRSRIGARELDLLPSRAFLINVARAEIVEEHALFEALRTRRIAGAALDVWYEYPAPGGRGYGSRLPFHELPNVYGTPHYSAWTGPMILRRIAGIAENLNRFARGEPLERVLLEGVWRPEPIEV